MLLTVVDQKLTPVLDDLFLRFIFLELYSEIYILGFIFWDLYSEIYSRVRHRVLYLSYED